MPSLSRNVATPDSAEIPAPVRTTMRSKTGTGRHPRYPAGCACRLRQDQAFLAARALPASFFRRLRARRRVALNARHLGARNGAAGLLLAGLDVAVMAGGHGRRYPIVLSGLPW